jgi:hypothetical protein
MYQQRFFLFLKKNVATNGLMNDDRCEGQGTDSLVVPSRDTGKQSVSSIMMFRPLKISIASHHVGSAGEQSYVWCVTGPLGHVFL